MSLELTTKIGYAFMLLTLFGFNMVGFSSSWQNLEVDIEESHKEDFRKMTILNNVMKMELTGGELSQVYTDTSKIYQYNRQKGLIPVEYFKSNMGDHPFKFRKKDGHCYIDQVAGLDGENYAYIIRKMDEAPNTQLGCSEMKNMAAPAFAPALLVRKAEDRPRLPVRIYIYEVDAEVTPTG